jgi:hypothetical protein
MVGSEDEFLKFKFFVELSLIKKHYRFIKCTVVNGRLICVGNFKPTNRIYKYKIEYNGFYNPRVSIIDPIIEYNEDIHMYKDKCLCLHYPQDRSWTFCHRLYNTIIPWTHEWFVFYELYLITGKWEHDFVPHNSITR